jgi:hypothetical protein
MPGTTTPEVATMNLGKNTVRRKVRALPRLRFDDQQLTSFSGLVVFQALFSKLDLSNQLRRCFRNLDERFAYGPAKIVTILIVHILLGYRWLRDKRYYEDDPMVLRFLGLERLPDVSTFSRTLSSLPHESIQRFADLIRDVVLQRLVALHLRRVTLDFDGTVLGTSRWAEGAAIGYNPKRKGQRSYFPLFCMVAQTGQVLDILHRPGNVNDAHGAVDFIRSCVQHVRSVLPRVCIEIRMDSAFFNKEIIRLLHELKVEFTISVPFRGISDLKAKIEARRVWYRMNDSRSYFEFMWNSKKRTWPRQFRIVVVRSRVRKPMKGPIQLDLFTPREEGVDFRAIITNKWRLSARKIVALHHGRGSQETVFGELKSHAQIDYTPMRTLASNQIFLLSTIMAHNLHRELQMITRPRKRTTTEKRRQLWPFETLDTLRRKIIQRAGRLIWPQGRLTLSLSPNSAVRDELQVMLTALEAA